MKAARIIPLLIAVALTFSYCAGKKKAQDDGMVRVAGVLDAANCPLTKAQADKLKEFKPGMERGAFRTLYEVFDEKQTEALKKAFGSSPGRDGGPERPRYLFFAILFENAGCPLTGAQLDKIKAFPAGQGAFQQMQDILTEQQGELLQGMFNR